MANNEINNGINSGINNGIICLVLTGTMEFWMTFHINWECHHPNWRTPLFFRGVVRYTAKQIISYIIISIITIIIHNTTWWLIPLSKWGITPIISGLSLLIPFITGVIIHLLSGMSHQVPTSHPSCWVTAPPGWGLQLLDIALPKAFDQSIVQTQAHLGKGATVLG